MPEQESVQKMTVKNTLRADITTADGKTYSIDPNKFWPVFMLNLRRRQWHAVRHNLRHDAPRKLLRRY